MFMVFGILLGSYFSSDVQVQCTTIFQLYYKHALLISLVKVMLKTYVPVILAHYKVLITIT